jgi:hypothetical protein
VKRAGLESLYNKENSKINRVLIGRPKEYIKKRKNVAIFLYICKKTPNYFSNDQKGRPERLLYCSIQPERLLLGG